MEPEIISDEELEENAFFKDTNFWENQIYIKYIDFSIKSFSLLIIYNLFLSI